MNAEEIRNQANQARKIADWNKAESMFRRLHEEFVASFGAWDGWGWAQSLYKQRKYSDALEACRITYRLDPQLGPNRTLYAWTIWQLELKDADAPLHDLEKAAHGILKLVKQDLYSPAEAAIFRVVDKLNDAPHPDGEKMLWWLGRLDENLLGHQATSFTSEQGKVVTMASPLEKYYALLSKALYELDRFEACISVCNKAMERINPLHHGNYVWFPRRIAECHVAQGKWQEARVIYDRITSQKRDWFLFKEKGDILMELPGSGETAMLAYAQAWQEPGDVNMKVGLLEDWARGALEHGKDYATDLAEISLQLKQQNGWRIDSNHLALAGALGIDPDSIQPLPQDFKQKITSLSKRILSAENERFEGRVINILPNGNAAFIEGSHGTGSIYCRASEFKRGLTQDLLGSRVAYSIQQGFDKKKNIATKIAVRVKPLNG